MLRGGRRSICEGAGGGIGKSTGLKSVSHKWFFTVGMSKRRVSEKLTAEKDEPQTMRTDKPPKGETRGGETKNEVIENRKADSY